jgi:DNA-binding SARP family transcriptional activator
MRLFLFDAFLLCRDGHTVILQPAAQRLIALVALRTVIGRDEVGGILWPDVPDTKATARLRTTLWRLQRSGPDVLNVANGQLTLRDQVWVDYQDWIRLAASILDRPESVTEVNLSSLRPHGELLPGWYHDWTLLERERVRHLQLHVLEVAADQLLRQGRPAMALEFALGALRIEPIRESAHRLAIRVHLAEGNVGEAWRQFRHCESVLGKELGISPSSQLRALMTNERLDANDTYRGDHSQVRSSQHRRRHPSPR